ncbi:CPBP family intramembrane glutamic endopeptidase [Cytobacillus purgationiresistens]|uniref:Membrane protease YdiL (CAAX protease family) n=1 Tax=Cytobacillus purgationiresistens TaxID=863449 RepID=A0ABU0ARF8_9BACI|nr:CPBP family intramembrane glutamic endopeptidase [Cytobacillus purgationiresistens]MDQ0273868.1 membrane protease YdiL (CAAX protease family) [Cytobacillus purgationiresistens]
MKKEYWFILIVYIAMQLSGLVGIPIIFFMGDLLGWEVQETRVMAAPLWIIISFSITILITLLLLRNEMKTDRFSKDKAPVSTSVAWAIGGIFLAFIAQSVAANIEMMLGIEMGSENTQQIMGFIETSAIVILVVSIIGPILEEIIFRKIIFGSLHKRLNFFLSALISSLIFSLAHGEIEHLILYAAMGFTFAFLYVKTNRIIVPIFAHVAMNTFVVIMQLNMERIEKWLIEMENLQVIIGGLL